MRDIKIWSNLRTKIENVTKEEALKSLQNVYKHFKADKSMASCFDEEYSILWFREDVFKLLRIQDSR